MLFRSGPPVLALNIALLFRRGAIVGGFAVDIGLGGDLFPIELWEVVREIVGLEGVLRTPLEVDGRLDSVGLEIVEL